MLYQLEHLALLEPENKVGQTTQKQDGAQHAFF